MVKIIYPFLLRDLSGIFGTLSRPLSHSPLNWQGLSEGDKAPKAGEQPGGEQGCPIKKNFLHKILYPLLQRPDSLQTDRVKAAQPPQGNA